MVNLDNITFAYGTKRALFNELQLDLQPGNIYGLLGKNGAGKSTLLNIIGGALFVNSGTCSVLGARAERRTQHGAA